MVLDQCTFLSWFTGESNITYGGLILARSNSLKTVKNVLMVNLFLTNTHLFTSLDVKLWTGVVWITCGLLWCFYQLFGLSFWRHPFTAEDPLVNQWCNAKFLQICSDEETNSSILNDMRVSTFSASFHFWVNYSFKLQGKNELHMVFNVDSNENKTE